MLESDVLVFIQTQAAKHFPQLGHPPPQAFALLSASPLCLAAVRSDGRILTLSFWPGDWEGPTGGVGRPCCAIVRVSRWKLVYLVILGAAFLSSHAHTPPASALGGTRRPRAGMLAGSWEPAGSVTRSSSEQAARSGPSPSLCVTCACVIAAPSCQLGKLQGTGKTGLTGTTITLDPYLPSTPLKKNNSPSEKLQRRPRIPGPFVSSAEAPCHSWPAAGNRAPMSQLLKLPLMNYRFAGLIARDIGLWRWEWMAPRNGLG